MTRNVYLGADLPPIALAQPGPDFEAAAGKLLDDVEATDPRGRMRLIGDEIAEARPDLVGLQEVSLYRTGPQHDPKPATRVRYDFVALIRAELARRHQPYRVVAKRYGLNVEGPSDRNVDVRLSLGDVTLARKGVKVAHERTGVFEHQLSIPSAQLGPVSPARSWNALDATIRGVRLHFVNTHLEAYSTGFRLEQAKELVAGPLRSRRQTVLVGAQLGPDPAAARRPAALPHDRARRLRAAPHGEELVLLRRPRGCRALGPQRRLDHDPAAGEARILLDHRARDDRARPAPLRPRRRDQRPAPEALVAGSTSSKTCGSLRGSLSTCTVN